jgi:Flp pilus assembly protein TadG
VPMSGRLDEMTRFRISGRGSRKGSAIVEVAFLLPFLLLILFGIIDFGRALWTTNVLHTAAREGARVMAITAEGDTTDVIQRINEVLATAGITPEAGDVTLTWPSDPTDPLAPVTVQINYEFELFTGPVLGVVPGAVPLSARCVMKYEAGTPSGGS